MVAWNVCQQAYVPEPMLLNKGFTEWLLRKLGKYREAYGQNLHPALNQWVQGLQPAAAFWVTTL